MKFGTEYLYIKLLSNSEYRKNECSERKTVLRGVKEFVSLISTFVALFG
jgi:hypothetical protein